ncbi:unnamed protein product [Urochloa decumbens]|uniref:Uncharacterized protein n=1 Tax=Urochloa decumbens TaxID=240449 RepID=A0ABC9EZF7_9POAL
MGPVKLLLLREIASRVVITFPSSAGMKPRSLLSCRAMVVRLMQELRLAGNVPENELPFSTSVWRRRRRPRLAGISPYSPLELRLSVCRKVRFPTAGESAPVRPLPPKLSAVTRSGLRRLQVTPSQLQKLVLLFQDARIPEPPLMSCALKASSVASSVALTVGIVSMAMRDSSQLKTPIAMAKLFLSFVVGRWR